VSVVTDEEKLIYGITCHPGNMADIKTLDESITNINKKFKYRKINMTGDKSYISKEKKKALAKIKISLHYPHRKNMKKKTPKRSKKHLMKRHTVENTIRTIKYNNRVVVRRDRLIKTYISFILSKIEAKTKTNSEQYLRSKYKIRNSHF